MKKQLTILMIAYFSIYLVVLAIYLSFKYFGICHYDIACSTNEDNIINILTVTSYILTPALAISGFLNWKVQHNSGLLAEEAKQIFIEVNNDLKCLKKLKIALNKILKKQTIDEDVKDLKEIEQQLNDANVMIYTDALMLYEMSDDTELSKIREDYHEVGLKLIRSLKHLQQDHKIELIESQIFSMIKDKEQSNAQFKQLLRKYIIFK